MLNCRACGRTALKLNRIFSRHVTTRIVFYTAPSHQPRRRVPDEITLRVVTAPHIITRRTLTGPIQVQAGHPLLQHGQRLSRQAIRTARCITRRITRLPPHFPRVREWRTEDGGKCLGGLVQRRVTRPKVQQVAPVLVQRWHVICRRVAAGFGRCSEYVVVVAEAAQELQGQRIDVGAVFEHFDCLTCFY
ncbi:uncharacterized protein K452DRAFT_45359 [Aplosporella prunicola CBS 121167]|uniref:Uncharacterized protein n=1 Tax=Aplosporella prunicola CBS 121167 TaxID=1176127 RepID=A0A6A6BD14_9PEZI|nr:uncharacterized protein K452DRAFT_45359 [Aplosporella prunicola CBS 121167]KAF2141104.1 hypothetical protein K452DRAFT_45359 [Aplosporella prunicola CBS 121167]